MKKGKKWQVFHRWAGLLLSVIFLLFCISGIILNHRETVADCNVSRSLLPSGYRIRNFNNGAVKGSFRINEDSLLAFGNTGIWLTDRNFSDLKDFNAGLPAGMDRRNIRNIVRTSDGKIWAASQFCLYRLDGTEWTETALPGNDNRIADLTVTPDSCGLAVLSRSAVFIIPDTRRPAEITYRELPAPEGHRPEVSMFKTVWMLHSGELFGTPGKIIVDIIAVVIGILCITGIIIFILPYSIRRAASRSLTSRIKRLGGSLKWNVRWHDRIGYWLIPFTLLIAVTGMCLRPPLMIPLALTKTSPLPGSTLDNANIWHDKLRAIRYDRTADCWLISTSDGFVTIDRDFKGRPDKIAPATAPPVSPMGINVMKQQPDGSWLTGSFSGMFIWNRENGSVRDYFTGKPYEQKKGRPTSDHMIAGYSDDTAPSLQPVIFDYVSGADRPLHDNDILYSQPMSLWNTALELHVGRCYSPLLGPFSELFVFFSGLFLTLVIVSGYIVHRRIKRKN